jgi:hypothetical protein
VGCFQKILTAQWWKAENLKEARTHVRVSFLDETDPQRFTVAAGASPANNERQPPLAMRVLLAATRLPAEVPAGRDGAGKGSE